MIMNTKALPMALVVLTLWFDLSAGAHAQGAAADEQVRAVATRWEMAWNNHDMKALAALFTDDADFVNVGARHWKGRAEIEKEHAARLNQFVDSVWSTLRVGVQFLTPDVALAHIAWSLRGDKDPDGTARPSREGLFTWVVVRQGGQWLVRAAQNTNQGPLQVPKRPVGLNR
jgi:uncharacterized protein (TIGR02246 family)